MYLLMSRRKPREHQHRHRTSCLSAEYDAMSSERDKTPDVNNNFIEGDKTT